MSDLAQTLVDDHKDAPVFALTRKEPPATPAPAPNRRARLALLLKALFLPSSRGFYSRKEAEAFHRELQTRHLRSRI